MKRRQQRGFTLIEMLVSLALFSIVMVVCVGALLSLVGANKKAQALESAMNNLNISIDSMVRNLREGDNYNGSVPCEGGNSGSASAHDCTGGSTEIQFTPVNATAGQTWVYEWVASGASNCKTSTGAGGCLMRSENGVNGSFSSMTAPEVAISKVTFYVVGTAAGDTTQPRVIVVITGTAGGGLVKDTTTFHIQATALQRVLDL